MNRTRTITGIMTLAILTTATMAWAWGGKKGDGNATGQITQMKVSNPQATVVGITQKGPLWLAYTVRWNDGTEIDYKPIRVKGKFTKSLTFAMRPQGLREVIVCLWRYKVSAKRCAKDNGGKVCQYCKKNGFHMEHRIDRKTGS